MKRLYMKNLFLIVAGITALAFSGCEKETYLTETFRAKYVAGMCGQNIIQILDSAYFDKGINWTNSSGQAFERVFTVQNSCDFSKANMSAGEEFTCRLIADPGKNDCIVCMAYMETPPKAWNIKVVK